MRPKDWTITLSRLVARDFRDKGDKRDDWSKATPPLDRLEYVLALSFKQSLKLMVTDAKQVQCNGEAKPEDRNRYVMSLEETSDQGICSKLKRLLYRMMPPTRSGEQIGGENGVRESDWIILVCLL